MNSTEEHNICCNQASSSLSQYHLKMTNTSSSSSASVSRRNDTNDANDRTQGEGIALCSALTLTFILVVVGNLLTIVIFAKNKNVRKKYLLLVVNMAFADLFLGALSLPVYTYDVGYGFRLWTTFVGNLWTNKPILIYYFIVDTWFFHVPKRFSDMVNLFNYLNSFVNPIFYALRIAEFRRALALCCTGRHVQAAVNTKLSKRRKETQSFLKEGKRGTEFSRELAFEQDVMDIEISHKVAFEQNVMDTKM